MKRRFEHLESARPERQPDGPRPMRTRFEPGLHSEADAHAPVDPGANPSTTTRPTSVRVPDDEIANRLPPEAFAAPTTSTAARFAPEAPSIALADRETSALPFRRCATCGVDSHRLASSCRHCGSDLETAAQRAFMADLAVTLAAQKQAEEAQSAAFAAAMSEQRAAASSASRAWGEALAAQSRQRTEAQWERDHGDVEDAPARWLLNLLPPHLRKPIGFGVAGTAVVLMAVGYVAGSQLIFSLGGLGVGILIAALFPRRSWWSGRRW